MVNSNSEEKKMGAGKPVKVEKYDIDEDPLGNTSRVAVNNRNEYEYSSRKSKSALSTNRVKKEELDVKKEEMDDNLGAVVHVVASPPPSTNRNSSFAKSLKSTGLISMGYNLLPEPFLINWMKLPLQENNSAAFAHGIVKKEELDDNLDIVSNFGRPPLTSSNPRTNFEKRENKKLALQSDRSITRINLHGSHSRVANAAPAVPSEANNSTAITEATSKATTFRHVTIELYAMEMEIATPLDELSFPKYGETTRDMVDRANAPPDLESDRNDNIRSDKDSNPDGSNFEKHKNKKWELLSDKWIDKSDLHCSYSRVKKASFIIPSEAKNSTSTLETTPEPATSRHETIEPYAMEVDTTAPFDETRHGLIFGPGLDETNVPREDRRTTDMVDTANQSSDSELDYNDDDCSDEDFDPYSKRRRHLSFVESDAESDSEAADQDVHDDDNSGESNDNKAAMDGKDPPSKDELQCLDCAAVFKTNTEFLQHIGSHKGYKRFQCDVCQKRFVKNAYLTNHKPIHLGVRPYKCSICEKSFRRNADLQRHNVIHTGEKPYKCCICEKNFSQSVNLKSHSITHTGDKHFKCSICGKSFKRNANLKSHNMIHTGERPCKCSICGKNFRRNVDVQRHTKIHTNRRNAL